MSDIKQGIAAGVTGWFLAWLSGQHWSLGVSVVILAILLTLAWSLLKLRILRQAVKAIRTIELWRAQPAKSLGFLIRLLGGVSVLVAATFVVRDGLERYHIERTASGLSWSAEEVWKAQCLSMKAGDLLGEILTDVHRSEEHTSELQ